MEPEWEIIAKDIQQKLGKKIEQRKIVNGGWLNRKWQVQIGEKKFLVKQFSKERYTFKKVMLIEEKLKSQILAYQAGIKCPNIFVWEHKIIQVLSESLWYMMMEYKEGEEKNCLNITNEEMYSLGYECGKMHQAFQKIEVGNQIFEYRNNKEQLYKEWKERKSKVTNESEDLLNQQYQIIMALKDDFWEEIPTGVTHCDLSNDNILFQNGIVSAILDFDRSSYTYQWQDIGRVILSFALQGDELNLEFIESFLKGYQYFLPLSKINIVKCLQLAWCIEIDWWFLHKEKENKIIRFKKELNWLTQHYFLLEGILGGKKIGTK